MTLIRIDEATAARLFALRESAQLCNQEGRVIGYFTPEPNGPVYEGLEPQIGEEELDRREQEGGGRPLGEILADLEKRG